MNKNKNKIFFQYIACREVNSQLNAEMEKRYEERRQRGRYDGPACYADVCT